MIRLNRLRTMMAMNTPGAFVRFTGGEGLMLDWFERHGMLEKAVMWSPRLSEKGYHDMRVAIAEYEEKRGGLK